MFSLFKNNVTVLVKTHQLPFKKTEVYNGKIFSIYLPLQGRTQVAFWGPICTHILEAIICLKSPIRPEHAS